MGKPDRMPQPSPESVFDTVYHAANFKDCPQLLLELIDLFIIDASGLAEEIRCAGESHDTDQVASLTHKMRGSCASVGAIGLRRTAELIERAAVSRDCPSIMSLLPALEQDLQAIIRERQRLTP